MNFHEPELQDDELETVTGGTGGPGLSNTIHTLDVALQKALDQEASIGETGRRLEVNIGGIPTVFEEAPGIDHPFRDAGMAEMTERKKNEILMNTMRSMLEEASQQGQSLMSLFQ